MASQSFLSSVLLMSSLLGDSFLVMKLFRLPVYFVRCLPLLLVPQIFPLNICFSSQSYLPYLPLFLVGHDVGYYGPPFFPVGSNFCASVYVHSCISGDVSQPSASLPSSTAFAIYHAFCYRLSCLLTCP